MEDSKKAQKQNTLQNILLILISILLSILAAISILTFMKISEISDTWTSPTPTPTPTPMPIATPSFKDVTPPAIFPSQILDLRNWKITLPTGENETPSEIKQPQLSDFAQDPWFVSIPAQNAVRFRASVNGITTSGSNYPRSELREMTNNGRDKASWSSTSGTHSMIIDQAITALPDKKDQIVAGQIHDADNDIIVIRLERKNLYVNANGENVATLSSNYLLGTRFTVKFLVRNGKTSIYYNGNQTPSYTLTKDFEGAYFKAGAYTQSNCSKEVASNCNDQNYGEVVIFKLSVSHQ